MYDAYVRYVYHSPSVLVDSLSYDAVVGTLLEFHYYFNISKNHDDPLFTTSKLALYRLCSSWFDGFWGLYRRSSRLESVRFLGIIKRAVAIIIRAYTSSNQHSTDSPSILEYTRSIK